MIRHQEMNNTKEGAHAKVGMIKYILRASTEQVSLCDRPKGDVRDYQLLQGVKSSKPVLDLSLVNFFDSIFSLGAELLMNFPTRFRDARGTFI